MSDRSAAYLFGECFRRISSIIDHEDTSCQTEIELKDFTNWLWEKIRKGDYDFSYYQMSADDALLNLGLARWVEEKGEQFIIYKDDVGWR